MKEIELPTKEKYFDFFQYLGTEKAAEEFLENERWSEVIVCPRCLCDPKTNRVTSVRERTPMPFWCRDCRSYFSVRTDSPMEKALTSCQKLLFIYYLSKHDPDLTLEQVSEAVALGNAATLHACALVEEMRYVPWFRLP